MINRLKYNEQDTWLNAAPFLSQQDKDFWGYINYDYKIHKKAFESVTPYLRKLGIKRNDIVISLPDGTINHTLFLMDQRGYSGYGYGHFQGENATNDRIAFYVSIGAKYLILDNQDILNEIDKQYTSNQIGSYQNILIYKLTEQ